MRHLALILAVFAGNALAHGGHGGLEGHLHGWGLEHAVLLAAVLAALVYALKK